MKLSRIENREQGVRSREVEQLLDVYAVTDQSLREWLIELASAPRERGIGYDIRKHLPEELHRFLDWEAALVACRQFETLLVPGLLQTADYAHALITGIEMNLAEEEVERRVVARLGRQRILSRANPPHLHVILDVGALERPVGGPRIMRDQFRRLSEAIDAPNIAIQVLPKDVGASPAPRRAVLDPEPARAGAGHRLRRRIPTSGLLRGPRQCPQICPPLRYPDRPGALAEKVGEVDR